MRKRSIFGNLNGPIIPINTRTKNSNKEEILLFKNGGNLPEYKLGEDLLRLGSANAGNALGLVETMGPAFGPWGMAAAIAAKGIKYGVGKAADARQDKYSMSHKYGVDTQKFGFKPYENKNYEAFNVGNSVGNSVGQLASGMIPTNGISNLTNSIDDKSNINTNSILPKPINTNNLNYTPSNILTGQQSNNAITNPNYINNFGYQPEDNYFSNENRFNRNSLMNTNFTQDTPTYANGGRNIWRGMYANGGSIQPQYEAEGGEVIQGSTPAIVNGGSASKLSSGMFKLNGNKHTNGGIEASGGDYIFSDKLKLSKDFLSNI